ncbi:MAG: GNAT family N-acetyltransferase [Desulfobacterales bacterium]|nr:GNAT family N-acetyltransferase [Desulfobacterales bacterium]MBF0397044.1 GNAT family N-acetyltransferase [Desulfobacterales bacterium]
MTDNNLDKIFNPNSIAVIGFTEEKENSTTILVRNIMQGGFAGKIYAVDLNNKNMLDLKTYSSLLEIEEQIDLVLHNAPLRYIPQIVKDCIEKKIGGLSIIHGLELRTDPSIIEIEAAIQKKTQDSDLRIIGPTGFGIISTKSKLNASFTNTVPCSGKTAFLSQSSAICSSILDLAIKRQMGFSHFIGLGSRIDVGFADMIEYLGGDPDVKSIIIYMESLNRFRKFMSAARAVSRIKPIIVLKAGRTQAGISAATTYDSITPGEDAVYDSAFKRAGIVRVKTFEELFDCAEFLSKHPKPAGAGLAIITNYTTPAIMALDALSDYGIEPLKLNSETTAKLSAVMSSSLNTNNPIDILADATPERYQKAIELCLNAPEVNGLLIMFAPQIFSDPVGVAIAVADILKGKDFPVFTTWLGGPIVEEGRKIFNKSGIPTFNTPERAVRAFANLYRYAKRIEMLQEVPPNLPKKLKFDHDKAKNIINKRIQSKKLTLTEVESKALLSAYGIPVNRTEVATTVTEALNWAEKLGFPVVMKIYSRDIVSKSDAYGVQLNLRNINEVIDAFVKVTANAKTYSPNAEIEGVTIQSMLKKPDYELFLGSKTDKDFGPVIIFGTGGIMTEVLQDISMALPPLNRLLARRLMEETKVYRILSGYRNYPPANLILLEEILIRLSQLIIEFPEIDQIDINPFFTIKNHAFAVDARVTLKSIKTRMNQQHLVISSYPNQYEKQGIINEIGEFLIRPIRPEDAPLLEELFTSISTSSICYRFFSPLKYMPHAMFARFTQIDYDKEIIIVALSIKGSHEKMLGVARIIPSKDPKSGEFAVLISDVLQGKGIGAELLKQSVRIAKDHGIEKIKGTILTENVNMIELARKLGFDVIKSSYENEYELNITLDKFNL